MDLTKQEDVVALMSSATSESDWNSKCDQVQKANAGYPSFWFGAIILSGLAAKITAKFGKS